MASASTQDRSFASRHGLPVMCRPVLLPAGPPPLPLALREAQARNIITTRGITRIPPKNVHVKAACDTCRRRKIKCSGERPACLACERGAVPCTYISGPAETHAQALKRKFGELQDEKSFAEQLCSMLCSMSEPESIVLLRRLREEHGDVAEVVRQVRDGYLLMQVAEKSRKGGRPSKAGY